MIIDSPFDHVQYVSNPSEFDEIFDYNAIQVEDEGRSLALIFIPIQTIVSTTKKIHIHYKVQSKNDGNYAKIYCTYEKIFWQDNKCYVEIELEHCAEYITYIKVQSPVLG